MLLMITKKQKNIKFIEIKKSEQPHNFFENMRNRQLAIIFKFLDIYHYP